MLHARRIRPGEGALLRTIRLRALEGAPDAFGTTLAEALAYPDDAWGRRAAECASGDSAALFFLEDQDGIAGMAGGAHEADDPIPVLISMWVEPDTRGRGGGEALIKAVVSWAHAQGAARLQLWVTETNLSAIALYRRTGFTETGETQPLPSNPALDERRMMRDI